MTLALIWDIISVVALLYVLLHGFTMLTGDTQGRKVKASDLLAAKCEECGRAWVGRNAWRYATLHYGRTKHAVSMKISEE